MRKWERLLVAGAVRPVEGRRSPDTAIEPRVGTALASGVIVPGLCYLIPDLVHRFEPEVATAHGHE